MKSLGSRDRIERMDAVRELIAHLAAMQSVTQVKIARSCGMMPGKWRKMLEPGSRTGARLGDLPVLVELLGVGVLEPFAALAGYRLVPHVPGRRAETDVVSAVAVALRECSDAASAAAQAVTGGITTAESARCRDEIQQARRALDALEATIDAATVTPHAVPGSAARIGS